jgi:hypothetical protein
MYSGSELVLAELFGLSGMKVMPARLSRAEDSSGAL